MKYIIPIVTIIGLGILFFQKRTIGYGNAIIMGLQLLNESSRRNK